MMWGFACTSEAANEAQIFKRNMAHRLYFLFDTSRIERDPLTRFPSLETKEDGVCREEVVDIPLLLFEIGK